MTSKKQIKYVIMIAFVFCLSFIIMGDSRVDAKSKVVKVTVTEKNKSPEKNGSVGRCYGIIKGIDKKGKTVWKYRTPIEEMGETSGVFHKTKGKYVYIMTASTFIKLEKGTGKEVCKEKNSYFYGATSFHVQKNGTCYVSKYFHNTLVKISSNGKVIWVDDFSSTKYFWPYKVKMKKKTLIVWFESNYDDTFIPHKMVISKKNGDILSGKK